MKPRVYIETTIPSYLTARPSRLLVRAAQQQVTRDWWARRDGFELLTAQLVHDECAAGDPGAAADRLSALAGIPLLDTSDDATELADELVGRSGLPDRARADALHIAVAALHRVEYLLTWNLTHLANAVLRSRVERLARIRGYALPLICTPMELMPEVDDGGA